MAPRRIAPPYSVAILYFLVAVHVTAAAASPVWAQSGRDASHTRRSPYTGTLWGELIWNFSTTNPGES